MSESVALGDVKEIRLEQGCLRYREVGVGEPILFVHGVLVNGVLWRDVVTRLSGRFRCVVLDLPLGGHSVAMRPEADLSPRGVANIIADFMEALDLRDVTLVGNDTGGAICQIVVANHPGRIGRLVLTNCDAYEAFFPLFLRPVQLGARVFGTRFVEFLTWTLRPRPVPRLTLRTAARRRVEDEVIEAYFAPLVSEAGIRRDLTRFLAQVSNRYTLEAARTFSSRGCPLIGDGWIGTGTGAKAGIWTAREGYMRPDEGKETSVDTATEG